MNKFITLAAILASTSFCSFAQTAPAPQLSTPSTLAAQTSTPPLNSHPVALVPNSKPSASAKPSVLTRAKDEIQKVEVKLGLKKTLPQTATAKTYEPHVIADGDLERSCCLSPPGSN